MWLYWKISVCLCEIKPRQGENANPTPQYDQSIWKQTIGVKTSPSLSKTPQLLKVFTIHERGHNFEMDVSPTLFLQKCGFTSENRVCDCCGHNRQKKLNSVSDFRGRTVLFCFCHSAKAAVLKKKGEVNYKFGSLDTQTHAYSMDSLYDHAVFSKRPVFLASPPQPRCGSHPLSPGGGRKKLSA